MFILPILEVQSPFVLIIVDNSLANWVTLTCSSQCCWQVKQRQCHVLSYLCDNACKRSWAICRNSMELCPVSRSLSVPIWPACAEQGSHYNTNKAISRKMKVNHTYIFVNVQTVLTAISVSTQQSLLAVAFIFALLVTVKVRIYNNVLCVFQK